MEKFTQTNRIKENIITAILVISFIAYIAFVIFGK